MKTDNILSNRSAEELREEAERCRRLASLALDRRTLDALNGMASECDEHVRRLSQAQ